MIQKVALYFILPMCIVAFFLSMVGVTHIDLNDTYYSFISSTAKTLESWRVEIPSIPKINSLSNTGFDTDSKILQVLVNIANALIGFINVIIYIINIVIMVLNVLIELIQFICSAIWNVRFFIERLRQNIVVAYV